jgi:hypothetical protein
MRIANIRLPAVTIMALAYVFTIFTKRALMVITSLREDERRPLMDLPEYMENEKPDENSDFKEGKSSVEQVDDEQKIDGEVYGKWFSRWKC